MEGDFDKDSINIFRLSSMDNEGIEAIHRGQKAELENILNKFGFKKITEGHGSFLKGQEDNNLIIDNLSILPLICYESIYS